MDRIRDVSTMGSPPVPIEGAANLAARLLKRSRAGSGSCHVWTGHIDPDGYGKVSIDGRSGYAHRAAYQAYVGLIPQGMQIDHLCHSEDPECGGGSDCRHRRCINPLHLEAVTARENSIRANNSFVSINARKTHCNSGHPFEPGNTYVRTNGSRKCRTCQAQAEKRYKAKRQAIRSAGV